MLFLHLALHTAKDGNKCASLLTYFDELHEIKPPMNLGSKS